MLKILSNILIRSNKFTLKHYVGIMPIISKAVFPGVGIIHIIMRLLPQI